MNKTVRIQTGVKAKRSEYRAYNTAIDGECHATDVSRFRRPLDYVYDVAAPNMQPYQQ